MRAVRHTNALVAAAVTTIGTDRAHGQRLGGIRHTATRGTDEEVCMAQPVLADGCGEKVLGPRLVDDAIEGGSDRNVARHSPCTPSTQARPRR